MLKKGYQVSLLIVVCILLNYGLKMLTLQLNVPLWLDSVGTAIAAYLIGPASGAMVGAASNIAFGFYEPLSMMYTITNAAVGIVIGVCARRKMMEKFFDVITASTMVTVVAATISTIINCVMFAGHMGNEWGDGILNLLVEWKMPWVISAFIAEFFLDFLDKIATLFILYLLIILFRRGKKLFRGIGSAAVIIFLILLVNPIQSKAQIAASDYNSYIQTIYNNENGLKGGEANDIAASEDGVIWIGTYAGLYRYSGTEFQYINYFDSVKNVNCLYVDVEGRLWIGTNDDGMSSCIDGQIVTSFRESSGLPSNSVRSIVQQSTGSYFVGTSSELAVVSLVGGAHVTRIIPEIIYAMELAADDRGNVIAITAAGKLFWINEEGTVFQIPTENNASVSCCEFSRDGLLYVGDYKGHIYVYKLEDDTCILKRIINNSGMIDMNSITQIESGEFFICTENGIGWLDKEDIFHPINTGNFNSSIDDMTVDYQGNLWFSSSRLGVLKLSESVFTEIYSGANLESKVVNAIASWNGKLYFGTDNGLDVIYEKSGIQAKTKLAEYLGEARIRCLFVDSGNNLWVCANGYGVFYVNSGGKITSFSNENGALGKNFRNLIELQDGTIAVGSDQGITFIKNDEVIGVVGEKDGLTNSLVLCLAQLDDGRVLAGTDGGGIAVIEDGRFTEMLTREDGLGSGVILRMTGDADNENLFIVTSNGICYWDMEQGIRKLNNFPYSNNYDLYDTGNGKIYTTSSAGVFGLDKEELLGGGPLTYENLNYLNGLRSSFTANAWNYMDEQGNWYIAAGTGVTVFSLDSYMNNNMTYRMLIRSVMLDDTVHYLHGDTLIKIPRGVSTLQIFPEIINFSSTEPFVCYYMEGLGNEERTTVLQSELNTLVFGNLNSGTYKFHLSILDGVTGEPTEELVYTIIKEAELYDHVWFKVFFFTELILIVVWMSWHITKTFALKKMEYQRREIALAKEQVRMGNETILAIARTVDAKDSNTSQHSTRVSEYSVMISKELGYSTEMQENLRKAALLHDIGKIGIPDAVLNKPAKLTNEEYEIMKSHVTRGAEILKDFTLINNVKDGVLYHHERFDGTGYAQGLKGKDIPEMARIIGIADAFDAMTANRVYRKKLDFETVLGELQRGRGKQFDPDILDIFLNIIDKDKFEISKLYKNNEIPQAKGGNEE